MAAIECHYDGDDITKVICNGTLFTEPEKPLTYRDEWFWIYIGIYVVLVLFAGLMSGLTIGLLSLDMMSLNVLQEAGTPSEQRHAKRIIPIIKRHHLLLVTLLLANAACVESMPLFLDRVSDPIIAIVVSVSAVLLFGEVFPQALCSRYGLAIGACMVPLVYLLMVLFFPVSFPIAKLLDCLLGSDHATFFRRAELKALVSLHGPDAEEQPEDEAEKLTMDEVLIIKGALELRQKVVADAMIPMTSVFMADVESVLDAELLDQIISASHSRVPMFAGNCHNVVGMLLVKRLIGQDLLSSPMPLKTLLNDSRCTRPPLFVTDDMPLYDLLNVFQTGKGHMACVLESVHMASVEELVEVHVPQKKMLGIITLEDVLEELLQEEIVDETDVYIDVHKRVHVARAMSAVSKRSSISLPKDGADPGKDGAPSTSLARQQFLRRRDQSGGSHLSSEASTSGQYGATAHSGNLAAGPREHRTGSLLDSSQFQSNVPVIKEDPADTSSTACGLADQSGAFNSSDTAPLITLN